MSYRTSIRATAATTRGFRRVAYWLEERYAIGSGRAEKTLDAGLVPVVSGRGAVAVGVLCSPVRPGDVGSIRVCLLDDCHGTWSWVRADGIFPRTARGWQRCFVWLAEQLQAHGVPRFDETPAKREALAC